MRCVFGKMPCGTPVESITLRSDAGLEAELLTYGGILRGLRLSEGGRKIPLVLELPDLAAYLSDPDNLGILVGRFGNRIGGGKFTLDGVAYQLDLNEGHNHLHGGRRGFGRQLWTIAELGVDHAVLAYTSPAGEEGYPGKVEVSASFRLNGLCMDLVFKASTDAATPFNPTHHPYFNLAGDPAVPAAEQVLRVPADHYLPVDAELIPNGEIADVTGTPFDFRKASSLGGLVDSMHPQIQLGRGYDHCLVLADEADCTAELYSPHSGIAMRITSDAPAVQVYGGQGLAPGRPGLGDGICLEPQSYPDAPNHVQFPEAILRPGLPYERHIQYRFARLSAGRTWEQVAAVFSSRIGAATMPKPASDAENDDKTA